MKHQLSIIILTLCITLIITGCSKNENIGNQPVNKESLTTESGNSSEMAKNGDYTSVAASLDHDSIFDNLIYSPNVANYIHVVINGYDFAIDSSQSVGFNEAVGPVVNIGEQLQYFIKVKDETYDDLIKTDFTEKLRAAGGNTVDGPKVLNENGTDYTYYEYRMGEEHGIAVIYPSCDGKHAICIQVGILDDLFEVSEALNTALAVLRTTTVTTAKDTTLKDIERIYKGANQPDGIRIDRATIKFDKCKYSYSVPDGYYQVFSDEYEYRSTQYYESMFQVATVTLEDISYYENSRDYISSVTYGSDGDPICEIATSEGTIAYRVYYNNLFEQYEITSALVIDNKYIYNVLVRSSNGTPNISDIASFYNNSELRAKADEEGTLVSNLPSEITRFSPYTEIHHDEIFRGDVNTVEDALKLISEYGEIQRERYDNAEVKEIERSLQERCDIQAVNLGELDIETAKELEKGICYMFDTYPILKGSLNTISLANFSGGSTHTIALTQTRDFIQNNDSKDLPKVVRNEIILNANLFLNRSYMLKMCQDNIASGYWCKNADNPSKIIVHELGHQLLNVMNAKSYGFSYEINGNTVYMPCLITKNNYNTYLDYEWCTTAIRQDLEKEIVQASYEEWKTLGNNGSEEDFRGSISQYARGIQYDDGVSYHETFAEAIADVYINGDNASTASKLIVKKIIK